MRVAVVHIKQRSIHVKECILNGLFLNVELPVDVVQVVTDVTVTVVVVVPVVIVNVAANLQTAIKRHEIVFSNSKY